MILIVFFYFLIQSDYFFSRSETSCTFTNVYFYPMSYLETIVVIRRKQRHKMKAFE